MSGQQTLRLTAPQWAVYRDPARHRVLVAGRRFGKTHLAAVELMTTAVNRKGSASWYIAPTYGMARDIMLPKLKDIIPAGYISALDQTDLRITLRNGSTISLRSADNPDRLRGPGLDMVVLDEAAYMVPETWPTIRPALSDTGGRALLISTPAGYNWFYDVFSGATASPDWSAHTYTTAQGGNVPPEEIEAAKRDMDARTYRQEYEASFESLAGRVYYAYDRRAYPEGNTGDVTLRDGPVLVGMDFNINPMSAVFAQRVGGQIHVIGELTIDNGNTEEMARAISAKFPGRAIRVYPDPTGNARKTAAPVGQTDFTILRQHGFSVLAPTAPYPVADKINTVNTAMCTASGARSVIVNARACPQLCRGLDGLTYKPGTSEPDKSLGLDHITDALGYLLLWELPLRGSAGGLSLGVA